MGVASNFGPNIWVSSLCGVRVAQIVIIFTRAVNHYWIIEIVYFALLVNYWTCFQKLVIEYIKSI